MNHVEPVPGGTSESGGLPRPHRGRSHQLVRGLSLGVLGLVLAGNTTAKDLVGVYEDELPRLGEVAAREEAVRRFGDPAQLTQDLTASLSLRDRLVGPG